MKYASLDIETTGLYADKHQVTELAVVIDDLSDPKPIDSLPYFSTYVGHDEDLVWNMFALLMFKDRLKEYDEATKMPMSNLAANVMAFLGKQLLSGILLSYSEFYEALKKRKVTFAGKNFASFDNRFLAALPNGQMLTNIASHRCFDPGSLYFELGDTSLPSTEVCMRRAGISGTVSHRALDDARNVIRLIRYKHGISIT